MQRTVVLAWVALVMLLPTVGWSATYYVSPSGTSSTCVNGGQATNQMRNTVQAGMNCMAPGDTLYLRAGTYVETPTFGVNCTVGTPCLVAGYPGDTRPVIQSPAGNVQGWTVYVNTGSANWDAYVTLKGFTIDGLPITSPTAQNHGLYVSMQHVTIDDLIIADFPRNGVQLYSDLTQAKANYFTARNSQILRCGRIPSPSGADPFDTKGLGFYLSGSHLLVENTLIDGCYGGGGGASGGLTIDVVFRGNIIRNSGADSPWHGRDPEGAEYGKGFGFGGELYPAQNPKFPDNVHFYNNIIYNVHGSGSGDGTCANFLGATNSTFANNTCYNVTRPYTVICNYTPVVAIQNNIWANASSAINACGTIAGTISNNLTNPNLSTTFVNAPGGDFHLKTGSPAVDAGATIGRITTDFSCVYPYTGCLTRPQNNVYDIGAYELSVGGSPPPDIVTGLVAFWKLNEFSGTADDSSPNNNLGTPTGGATYVASGQANMGNAISLDGTSGSVTVPDDNTLDLTGSYTLTAWVNPASALTGWKAVVVKNYVYYIYGSSISCGAGGILAGHTTGAASLSVCHATPLVPNTWTHLAVTFDGNTMILYKNATLMTTANSTTTPVATTGTLQIGASQFGENFPGVIDSVRIYNRALSATEVGLVMADPDGVAPGSLPPTLIITAPASGPVASSPVTVQGTATDDFGVTSVSIACAPSCGSPTVTCTPTCGTSAASVSWSASVPLQPGSNVVTATAQDAQAQTNSGNLTLTLTTPTNPAPTVMRLVK